MRRACVLLRRFIAPVIDTRRREVDPQQAASGEGLFSKVVNLS
jgi:hypothetical protein